MEQPILNGLIQYNTEGSYPWHMPGHKRRLNTIFPDMVENPFSIDVTEVGDLDELHDPKGIILKAEQRASEIYGSDKSYYLVNGATGGIMAAIAAVCEHGDTIIVSRNCHKSVYNAIRLLGLKAVYIKPEWNDELCMFGGIDPDMVKKAMKEHTHAKAVVIVSPTYEGVVSDIEKIAKLVHKESFRLL
jgi:arginine/lysine/ornithine decarboxylase